MNLLRAAVERLVHEGSTADPARARTTAAELLSALEQGRVRAAEPDGDLWRVNTWVKQGILLAFRFGDVIDLPAAGPLTFRDKDLLTPLTASAMPGVRIVAGGTSVRRGAHVAEGAILMPPCYVNVGAYVGAGTMIDSHALVGSCAQVGAGVHLSAGVQIGGVLEPPGALPVVIEDGVFVGALSAVLEGVRVRRDAVLGAGVVLTRTTPVYDLGIRQVLRADEDGILQIPERAVVIAGSRPLADEWARQEGLCGYAALIVKRRDSGTDARAALEELLR